VTITLRCVEVVVVTAGLFTKCGICFEKNSENDAVFFSINETLEDFL
jgi:hypothetical protein